jgi:hypothetical protein
VLEKKFLKNIYMNNSTCANIDKESGLMKRRKAKNQVRPLDMRSY